jgi:ribosome maturation factor RimP
MFDDNALTRELEVRLNGLGFECVELERAGSKSRPVLRLRIDRPESAPGNGVSIADCARVSRELEAYLEAEGRVGERYVLEVSSPGVERPLVRTRDFERFAGHEVALLGRVVLAGRSRRIEGELIGIAGDGKFEKISIRLANGEVIEIPRADVTRAHLVFQWP